MMKVRALVNFASIQATLSVGQEANLSSEVAKSLIACGYVEKLKDKTAEAVDKDESK